MTGITQTGQTGGNGVAAKNVGGLQLQRPRDEHRPVRQLDDEQRGGLGSYYYDNDSRLTDLSYTTATGSTLAAYHWDYDADSRVSDMYSRNDTTGTPGSSTRVGAKRRIPTILTAS